MAILSHAAVLACSMLHHCLLPALACHAAALLHSTLACIHQSALFEAACLLPWSGMLSKAAQQQCTRHGAGSNGRAGLEYAWPARSACAPATSLIPQALYAQGQALCQSRLACCAISYGKVGQPRLLTGYLPVHACREVAEEHYKDLKDKPFFPDLIGYILSGPVVGMVSLALHKTLSVTAFWWC